MEVLGLYVENFTVRRLQENTAKVTGHQIGLVTIISPPELMLCISLLLTVQFHVMLFSWWHLSTINKRLTYLLTYLYALLFSWLLVLAVSYSECGYNKRAATFLFFLLWIICYIHSESGNLSLISSQHLQRENNEETAPVEFRLIDKFKVQFVRTVGDQHAIKMYRTSKRCCANGVTHRAYIWVTGTEIS